MDGAMMPLYAKRLLATDMRMCALKHLNDIKLHNTVTTVYTNKYGGDDKIMSAY